MTDEVVEVSKARLEALARAESLLNTLWNDKDEGLKFKRMVKDKVPTAKIPELDVIDAVVKPRDEKLSAIEEANKKLAERLDAYEKEKLDAKEEAEVQKHLDEVKSKNRFTDEGMRKVIERMKEKNNPDVESAAAWVLAQEPKTEPTKKSVVPGGFGKADLYGSATMSEDWKDLNLDPMGYADKEIMSILARPEDYKEMGGSL